MAFFDYHSYAEEYAFLKEHGTFEQAEMYLRKYMEAVDATVYASSRCSCGGASCETEQAMTKEWAAQRLEGQITVRNDLAMLYREQGKLAESLRIIQEIMNILAEDGQDNHALYAQFLLSAASLYLDLGEYDPAVEKTREAETILEKEPDLNGNLRNGAVRIRNEAMRRAARKAE